MADDLTIDPPPPWFTSCSRCEESVPFERVVILDLKNPTYERGVLRTESGGILRSTALFIQARHILYDQEENKKSIYCEGDILVEYQGHVLIGETFYFDFTQGTGVLTGGVTSYFPWQIGARTIRLLEDGALEFEDGYITTSEGYEHDVALHAAKIVIDCDKQLTCSSTYLTLYDTPLLPLPGFRLDLTSLSRPNIGCKVGWGGYLGPHVSLIYHAFSYQHLKAFLRVDGFLHHGAGVGIETSLHPKASSLAFYTRNYWAHDLAIDNPTKRNRYRFQGSYYNNFFDYKTTLQARYDVVSDAQMAADYNHESFNLNPAQETKLILNHKERSFLANLIVEARVNSFQSIDQQLPTLEWNLHPVVVPWTGGVFENYMKLSNILFITSHDLLNKSTEQAGRLEIRPSFYRAFYFDPFIITPRVGLIGIGYSNSPEHRTQNQILGNLSVDALTSLHRDYAWGKHILSPYTRFTHLTTPTSALHEHFIFTIDDAYTRFDELRFGIKNFFVLPFACEPLTMDLWANAFFDPENGIQTLPKSYLNAEWQLSPSFFWQMDVGLHYEKSLLDFFNTRLDWGFSEQLAVSLEYRWRSAFAWRKGDFYNFILDTARNQELLLASTLSDKRETFLATLFYRIHPDWSMKFISRYGFHAKQNRGYFEYEIESRAAIFDHWWLLFSYQHRESDQRFAFSLKLSGKNVD